MIRELYPHTVHMYSSYTPYKHTIRTYIPYLHTIHTYHTYTLLLPATVETHNLPDNIFAILHWSLTTIPPVSNMNLE